jgi:hypothetical protein
MDTRGEDSEQNLTENLDVEAQHGIATAYQESGFGAVAGVAVDHVDRRKSPP